jgi:hypothetical protein
MKYNTAVTAFIITFLGANFATGSGLLKIAAYSNATWKRMESAFNSFNECLSPLLTKNFVPEQAHIDRYIYWAYTVKKLRFATINTYISSLSTLYKLKGCNCYIFNSFPTKTALKGIRNLDEINVICERPRKVFSLPLLKILGHQIAITNWSSESKKLFWTAAVLLFFGSFRVSEILSGKELSYDPLTTLLWSDIMFFVDSVRIAVKFPKVFVQGGISVDLFSLKDKSLCPVAVLKSLLKEKSYSQVKSLPVFMFSNGKLLTPKQFNISLRSLLEPIFGKDALFFSSHSFRAAIPAALADHPMIASKEEVMGWGRWDSKAFEKYTRLKRNKRKETFENLWLVLNS